MSTTTAHEQRPSLDRRRWVDAGLAELTGTADGPPLDPPAGLVARVDELTGRIARSSRTLGGAVGFDGLAELALRAGPLGLRRRGRVSCGGACHLVRAADGWLAVSLARPDDREMLPAWLGVPVATGTDEPDRWAEVHERCRDRPVADLVHDGALLGLPVAALPPAPTGPAPLPGAVVTWPDAGTAPRRSADDLVVADLTSMWAGPLCGAVLARAGARVLKVESAHRRDGARGGPPVLWDHLNGDKEDVVVDLSGADGARALRELLARVDVVVEASRPRALRQLGIDPEALVAEPDGPTAWVSITGHGRRGRAAERVAFGDDAAVAGGLVAWWDDDPVFCGDAIADPLTGLAAAAAVLDLLATGGSGLLDVPMVEVARHFASGLPGDDPGIEAGAHP